MIIEGIGDPMVAMSVPQSRPIGEGSDVLNRILQPWKILLGQALRHPLARLDRLGTARRILGWQLRSRLASGQQVVDWIGGAKLSVRKGQTGLTGNLYYGLHEFADMAFFVHFLRPRDVFADIGANAGSYTVLAAKVAGAQVHAFEPVPATLADLSRNIDANDVSDRVMVHKVALGEEPGQLAFTTAHDAANHFANSDEAGTIKVDVRTADGELGGKGVTAIKIDVECAEHLVIGGARELLDEEQLVAIEIESLMPGVREAIEGAGFVERWYDPFRRELAPKPVGLETNNRLFVRNESLVAQRLQQADPIQVAGRSI